MPLLLNSPFVLPVIATIHLLVDFALKLPFRHTINSFTHPKMLTNFPKVLHLFATDSRKGSGSEVSSALLILKCAFDQVKTLIEKLYYVL